MSIDMVGMGGRAPELLHAVLHGMDGMQRKKAKPHNVCNKIKPSPPLIKSYSFRCTWILIYISEIVSICTGD